MVEVEEWEAGNGMFMLAVKAPRDTERGNGVRRSVGDGVSLSAEPATLKRDFGRFAYAEYPIHKSAERTSFQRLQRHTSEASILILLPILARVVLNRRVSQLPLAERLVVYFVIDKRLGVAAMDSACFHATHNTSRNLLTTQQQYKIYNHMFGNC